MSLVSHASDSKSIDKEKVTCKGCKWTGTSLRTHLNRTKLPCKDLYDLEALKKESEEQNKSKDAKRKYQRYHSSTDECQKKKAAVQKYRQEHQDKIELDKREYHKKKVAQQKVDNHSEKNIPSQKLAQELIDEANMIIEKEENDKKCSICEKVFHDKNNLRRHIKEVHGGQKHKCEVCPAAYNRQSELDQHTKSDWHYLEYNCDLCEETLVFKSMRSLIEHLIVKQPETEEESNSLTFKMRWTGIFVTCKSNKKGFTVNEEKGSLSSNARKCDKVWAHDKRMRYKEKMINDGLSRAKTMAKVKLELTKQGHEEKDYICVWCNVAMPTTRFCNSRFSLGNWSFEKISA